MKILVIGETCEDIFVYGNIHRLSPEAPVPVLNPIERISNEGMSGNVVANIRSMVKNADVHHWYQNEKIIKTRFVDKKTNHMFLRVDEGEDKVTEMNPTYARMPEIDDYDIVVVSDYDKGFLTSEWLKLIGHSSKLSILDSKKKLSEEVVNAFTFVKLNEGEADNNKELKKCKNLIVTLGSRGASFNEVVFPSPSPKETIDVSGAGDTFTAAFILNYYKTKNVGESIIYANQMASIVVSKRGVATP